MPVFLDLFLLLDIQNDYLLNLIKAVSFASVNKTGMVAL